MFAVHVHQASKTYRGIGQPAWSVQSQSAARRLMQPAVALDQVSFNVAEAEIFALVGAQGAGKSTLIRVLAGLLALDAGEARVFGLDVGRQRSQVQRLVNRVSVEASFFKSLSPLENLLGGTIAARAEDAEHQARALLARLGLDEVSIRRPMEALGRDVQQIIFLARAILGRPRLLLLDEPMAGLDLIARYRVREALREMREVYGVAILVATRERSEAESLADRFAVLEQGRLVAIETPQPAATRPAWAQAQDPCSAELECLEV